MKKSITTILFLLFCASVGAADTVSLSGLAEKHFDGRDLVIKKTLASNSSYTRYYITYKSGKLNISGILNIPKGTGPFPVIITAHGYINPKIYTNGRGLKREQDYLAKRGYAVLHPDYRNHAGSDKDDAENLSLHLGYTEDTINAVYAIKNSGIKALDKERIGLLGHSMGGLIGLNMMVTKPGLIKAYVLFAPMSSDYRDNFDRWILRSREEKYGPRPVAKKIIEMYGSPNTNPVFWNNISAKYFIEKVKDPVQVHHGTADPSVPIEWSEKLSKDFEEHGKTLKLYVYPGEKHEFINDWPTVMKRAKDLFDAALRTSK